MTNSVMQIPAAAPLDALTHFSGRFSFETDCWEVWDASRSGAPGFVLIDVRSPELFLKGHIPGAVNIPHGKITEGRMAEYAPQALFVVYCAGPHCNGADKGAVKLAKLRRPVKKMIGGVMGWLDEGFELAAGSS
jgi:rhodanese-related sulfurtransferase